MIRRRFRLNYANVVATIALFVALGGGATAAVLITGKNVKDSSLTGRDVKNNSLGSADVKNGDLLAQDFKAGQLPAGLQGPKGDKGDQGLQGLQGVQGVQGLKGDTGPSGSPDTSAQVLAKLLAVDGSGSDLDADWLDGLTAGDLQRRGTTTSCSSGTTVTGIGLNGDVTCATDETIETVPAARVSRSTAQPVASGFFSPLTFDTEAFDTDGLHSVASNTGRMTASRAGTYLVTGTVNWPVAGGTYRHLVLQKNGVQVAGSTMAPVPGIATIQNIATVVHADSGDYLELVAHHDVGANVDVNAGDGNTTFSMVWQGP